MITFTCRPPTPDALKYFQAVEKTNNERHHSPPLKVVALPSPDKITGAFVRNLDGEHGILSLALETNADGKIAGVPYVVPGGRFNELYCWDSYFIMLGLLQDGRTNLARGMADNLLYEVRYYGKIPNANRTYYLTRSQPPFLTSIIRAVYESGDGGQKLAGVRAENRDGRIPERLARQRPAGENRSI